MMIQNKTKKFGIWLLILGLLLAHIFLRSVAHGTETSYQTINNEYSILFPNEPTFVQQSLKLSDSQRLYYDIYLSPFEDKGVFMLLVATYPMPLSGGHELAGLQGLLKGIVDHHPDNQLIFVNLVETSKYPAINFLVQNTQSYFRGHAIMVGNKLYLIAMEGNVSNFDEKSFSQFLSSFKLKDKN